MSFLFLIKLFIRLLTSTKKNICNFNINILMLLQQFFRIYKFTHADYKFQS